MAFQFYNPNPKGRFVGDCTVRAICKLTNQDWDHVYAATSFQGFLAKDMPSGNATWGAYLARLGYIRKFIPDSYLGRYTVKDFCHDHPDGCYLLVFPSSANIAIPEGETVGTISVAFALDGNTLAGTEMEVTPAAVEQYFNVSRAANVSIWKGCCQTLSIRNTGTTPILVQAANIVFAKK